MRDRGGCHNLQSAGAKKCRGGCMAGWPEYDAGNRGICRVRIFDAGCLSRPGEHGKCKDGTPAGECKKGCFMRRGGREGVRCYVVINVSSGPVATTEQSYGCRGPKGMIRHPPRNFSAVRVLADKGGCTHNLPKCRRSISGACAQKAGKGTVIIMPHDKDRGVHRHRQNRE